MEELRRELAHRPLVLAAAALCVGLTAWLHPLNLLFLVPLLLARRPLPVVFAFAAGLLFAPQPVPLLREPVWVNGEAKVLNVPYVTPQGISADIEIEGKKLRALFPPDTLISRGELWKLQGKATPLGETSEGLRLQRIDGRIEPVETVKLADGPWPWRIADAWRRGYETFARTHLPLEESRWLSAFAFRIYNLEEEEMDALKETGTIHLIAASGIHVASLGLLGMTVGQLFGAPRKAILAAVLTCLVFYAMATGLHLPTIRAVLAFAIGASAYLFRREPDGLSALAVAVLAYLPFDSAQVYGLGFQLSVTVVGFLVLWPRGYNEEKVRTMGGFFRYHVRDLVAVSIVAALAAEPILALHEGKITLLTIPANVVSVPIVMLAILLTFVLQPLCLGIAMPYVGGLVAVAKDVILWADAIPNATLVVAPFSPYLLVPYYVAWIVFWRPRARPCD